MSGILDSAVGAPAYGGRVPTMRAQRLDTKTRTFSVEDVPIPTPGLGEVLVKVAYCGICHSDLSLIDGTFPALGPEVITQGHEASGTIAEIGPGVDGWAVGDRVVPAAGRPCLQCKNCRRGDLTHCSNLQLMAFAYDGAWAEYTVAQAGGLTRVPDNVPMEQAAILADAVSTPFGAVVHTGQVQVGESVGVWGAGGIGTHIVQLARLVGANPIIVMDVDDAILQRSLELGADHAFDSRDPDLAAKIRELTDGQLLDATFDAVGIKATFEQAYAMTGVRGRLVAVGLSAQEISLGTTTELSLTRREVRGHLGYESADIEILAKLVSAGRLDLSRSISRIIPLEEIAQGVEALHHHEGNPIRILVQP